MKKMRVTFLTFLLAIMTLSLSAQTKSNVVKTNLFSPILKTYWLSYEHLFNDNLGAQLGFFYTGVSVGSTNFKGYSFTPEARFYLSESPAPKGIYVAPGLRYSSFSLTDDIAAGKATYSTFGGALVVGAQTLLKEIITIEAYLGPAYSVGTLKVDSGTASDFDLGSFDGFGFRFGITIGVAF